MIKNYANFKGRASRKQYRRGVLWSAIVALPGILTMLVGVMLKNHSILFAGIGLNFFIGLLWLTPFLGLCVRRKHDLGKNGWALLERGNTDLFTQLSQPGENEYGPESRDLK